MKITGNPIELFIAASPLIWINELKIKNEKGRPIRFDDYPFMIDIYADTAKQIVIRKSAQVGVTTWAILSALHAAAYKGYNIIYTVPRASDVKQIVSSKVNRMIDHNPILKKLQKQAATANIERKQLNDGFIFFKGTISEAEAIMVTSDRNVYDEYDFSDHETINNYRSRLEGAESKKEEIYISTPTLPEFGIDSVWETSNQMHWRFKCSKCGKEQHMEWGKNIRPDSRYRICQKCHRRLSPEDVMRGRWVARYPRRETHGYWINQMMMPHISTESLIDYYEKAEKGVTGYSMQYFFNFKLGMPYASETERMHESLVLKNLTTDEVTTIESIGGVDVQENELYVALGTHNTIFALLVLRDDQESSKWTKLSNLMEELKIKLLVIDAGYKPADVLAFAEKYPYRVYMNWYRENAKDAKLIKTKGASFTSKAEFKDAIKIETHRTLALDTLVKKLQEGQIKFRYKPYAPEIRELIKHMSTMYVRTVETKDGKQKREWANTGKNDFVHALVYWMLANHIDNVKI